MLQIDAGIVPDSRSDRVLDRKSDKGTRPGGNGTAPPVPELDVETLRRHAWEIGERRAHTKYLCPDTYLNLCVASPGQAFVVWRLQPGWVESTAQRKGNQWDGARLVVRLYDVSFIEFNGFNAHKMRDVPVDGLKGERLLSFPLSGTTQLAEVGFVLRHGEFLPAARSHAVHFPSLTVSSQHDNAALYVDDRLVPEPVPSPWEAAAYMRERARPRLRQGLNLALLSFQAQAVGHEGSVATFVSLLASELVRQSQHVHVFVPAGDGQATDFERDGVVYHALALGPYDGPVNAALAFARALEVRLADLPPFDFFHMQDWMTALVPWVGTRPALLALSTIESTRRQGAEPTEMSRQIEKVESETARLFECLLVPEWLRGQALAQLGADQTRVHAFPMEGRPPDEWEAPLDFGRIKVELGLHPFDRMLLFVGPLDPGAGADLLIEALPTVVSRTHNARLVMVGCGQLHAHLQGRAQHMGVGHALRLLGHVELPRLIGLIRASEALLVPSRHRVWGDEGVVNLARRAQRPVMVTHGGPAHLVRHEENGLLVYDNPPSMVWGMSRLLEDSRHTEDMGRNGSQPGRGASWNGLARRYAELCASSFAELNETSTGAKITWKRGK
jgi:glycosyltransferase involved in cell wall biosynthesis